MPVRVLRGRSQEPSQGSWKQQKANPGRVGASRRAQWGAFLGAIVGIFFGIPGLILGPFIGALIGQFTSGSGVEHATRVGVATWVGLLFGTIAKLAISFTMLGIFVLMLIV